MPRRSPTICSVAPAPREADSQPPNTSRRERSRPGMAWMASASAAPTSAGVGEAAGRAVERHQLEGHLLRDGHHHLLELGLGAEAHQPDLAARRRLGQVGRLVERVGGPGIEHRRAASSRSSDPGRSDPRRAPASASGSGTMPPQTTMWNDALMCTSLRVSVYGSTVLRFGVREPSNCRTAERRTGGSVLRRVQAARPGAELDVRPLRVLGMRRGAVPEAGAAVDALLAVEGRHAARRPGAMAWPEQISMQILRAAASRTGSGYRKTTWSA